MTCTLTVTAAGHTATSTRTARGGYNEAMSEVCPADDQGYWEACV